MVTTVVNSLFDGLVETFPPDRSYSRADLKQSSMPRPVSDYLQHEMQTRLNDHVVPEVPPESWVDVQNSAVARARATYTALLADYQKIPASQWYDALRHACQEVVRFLVYPAATLADAVFEGEATVEPRRVLAHLDYYTPYPYFREVMQAYFDQKNVQRIDRARLEGLVARIDRQMTKDYSAVEWVRLLRPLMDVLDAAGHAMEVPVELLEVILREKGAENHLSRLQRRGSAGVVRSDELRAVFTPGEEHDDMPAPRDVRAGSGVIESPAREEARGPVPLWKQFEQGGDAVFQDRTSPAPLAAAASEPLWRQFRTEPDTAPPSRSESSALSGGSRTAAASPLSELERSVLGERGGRNRDLFIRHLFAGNADEYQRTLRKLSGAGSWSQASQIIAREIFQKHRVNIYSDPAVAFTDAAEAQYRS